MSACVEVHCQRWASGQADAGRQPVGAGSSHALTGTWGAQPGRSEQRQSPSSPGARSRRCCMRKWIVCAPALSWGWVKMQLNDAALVAASLSQGAGPWGGQGTGGQAVSMPAWPCIDPAVRQLAAICLGLVLKGFPPHIPSRSSCCWQE